MKIELDQIPEEQRLNTKQVMDVERIDRRTIWRRCTPGYRNELTYADKPWCMGRIFDARTLTPEGATRLRDQRLAEAAQKAAPGESAFCSKASEARGEEQKGAQHAVPLREEKPQGAFGFAAMPPEIAALAIPEQHKPYVWRRYGIVQNAVNGTWRKDGFTSKRAYVLDTARMYKDPYTNKGASVRTIERWIHDFKCEGILGLVDDKPGPAPHATEALETWQVAFIENQYIHGKSVTQCYDLLICETEAKQKVWTMEHLYKFPSRGTVRNHLREHGYILNALAQGKDVARAAAGYMDRRFDDEFAGDAWCTDEWQVDGLLYLDWRQTTVLRPWIITLLDERTTLILDWHIEACTKKKGLTGEMFIDLFESCLRKYWQPRWLVSDWGGHFQGRMGRQYQEIDREKLLGPGANILASLGIARGFPTERREPKKKNPRGNRMERRHGIYADYAQRDLGESWCGSNTIERKKTNVDANVELHKRYCRGLEKTTPLLSFNKFKNELFPAWVEEHNRRVSEANGLNGLAPAAAFLQYQPAEEEVARRKVSDEEMAIYFAEHFERTVYEGGIIQLPDDKRYDSPLLLDCRGEVREVTRPRHDHSYIVVLPDCKGEEAIIARKRIAVGTDDPDNLAWASERTAKLQKVIDSYAEGVRAKVEQASQSEGQPPLNPSLPKEGKRAGAKAKREPEEIACESLELESATKAAASGGPAEVESEILQQIDDEEAPSLYEFGECIAEEL